VTASKAAVAAAHVFGPARPGISCYTLAAGEREREIEIERERERVTEK
jgi:hypothetical protein